MKSLEELNFKKVNTITIEQYFYKGDIYNVAIEHEFSNENQKGKWSYFGGSIHETVPRFNSLEDLIEFLENKK